MIEILNTLKSLPKMNADEALSKLNIPNDVFQSYKSYSKSQLPPEYPYSKRMKRSEYEIEKKVLQIELIKFQSWVKTQNKRILIIVEGRDAAGKGGAIKRFMEHLNPRGARTVALVKPSSQEQGQWYFQRYIGHLPSAGEIVFFDRSWYNRAGVENVMNFCTKKELNQFYKDAPLLEKMLNASGIEVVKLYFSVGRLEQLNRLVDRALDPLKQWKLGEMDLESIRHFEAYTEAETRLFKKTHTKNSPWTIINSNDKKRARIEAIKRVLSQFNYPEKNQNHNLGYDPKIVTTPAT